MRLKLAAVVLCFICFCTVGKLTKEEFLANTLLQNFAVSFFAARFVSASASDYEGHCFCTMTVYGERASDRAIARAIFVGALTRVCVQGEQTNVGNFSYLCVRGSLREKAFFDVALRLTQGAVRVSLAGRGGSFHYLYLVSDSYM